METPEDLVNNVFALLFWFVGERNWTVQSTTTIVKPRREPNEYGCGDLVYAKFQGKVYRAAIVSLEDNKDDLTEKKVKLDNLLKDPSMSPAAVMSAMGVSADIPDDRKGESETTSKVTEKRTGGKLGGKLPTSRAATCKKAKEGDGEKKRKLTKTMTPAKMAKEESKEKKVAEIASSKMMAKTIFGKCLTLSSTPLPINIIPSINTTLSSICTTVHAAISTSPAINITAPSTSTVAPTIDTTSSYISTTAPAIKTTTPAMNTTAATIGEQVCSPVPNNKHPVTGTQSYSQFDLCSQPNNNTIQLTDL